MRALIDLAAARGAVHRPEPVAQPVHGRPTIGKLSSMYLYAWKSGLKTTYYLRSRPATRIAASDRRRRRDRQPRAGRPRRRRPRPPRRPPWPAPWRTPRPARPASDTTATDAAPAAAETPGTMLLDPGMDLTLRPMRVPDVLRAVPRRDQEHLDGRGGRPALRPGRPAAAADAGRAAPGPPAGRVLRHRRLDRRQQPRAQPVPAHQLARGADVPVAAAVRGGACTSSST